jgi:hypothetical protein
MHSKLGRINCDFLSKAAAKYVISLSKAAEKYESSPRLCKPDVTFS